MEQSAGTKFDLLLAPAAADPVNDTAIRNRDLLIDAYQKILGGNDDALIALLAEDVQFHEAEGLPYGGSRHGVAGARAGVDAMFGAWRHMRCNFQEFATAGDLVIAYFHVTATARASGEIYDGPGAEIWRFADGKVVEWRVLYWDTHAVRKVCGLVH